MNNLSKKSLAIVCPTSNFGGMELDSIKLAKKLSNSLKIVFITKKDGFIDKNFYNYISKDDHITLECFEKNDILFFKAILDFKNIIKEYNIKNIIYFGTSKLQFLYCAIFGTDINLILRHGTTRAKPKGSLFHKIIYSRVDIHIAISEHLLENVKKTFPFGKNTKSFLIYPSIEIKEYRKEKNQKLNILHVGRIVKGKGQLDAIKACEILIQNDIDFEFFIVGGYEENFKKEFLEFYNKIEYKNKIKLIGFSDGVEKYFIKADIFLFPSYGEGFGNAFIESLSFGCKAIAYKNTTFIEFKKLGFNFEIVENRSVDKLKLSLLNIAKNSVEFDIDKNIKLIKNNFVETNEINKYLGILV
ncbi:glycosyltransferase family 4 protein [Aliarcobacter butzleri]|uniref:glycosyltransferase family 4 protein n=1 Tax=Aliarcobacter butzleri TaxID=28197 RepID=UPI002B248BA1|nr:glycosyltransferase family 4 protein [Aliarcobacter butzleri]